MVETAAELGRGDLIDKSDCLDIGGIKVGIDSLPCLYSARSFNCRKPTNASIAASDVVTRVTNLSYAGCIGVGVVIIDDVVVACTVVLVVISSRR